MSASFQKRLQAAQRSGNLTVSDLARWFGRPIPTVRSWTQGTRPGGALLSRNHVEALMGLLEQMIKRKHGFPVPPHLGQRERIAHIAGVRKAALP